MKTKFNILSLVLIMIFLMIGFVSAGGSSGSGGGGSSSGETEIIYDDGNYEGATTVCYSIGKAVLFTPSTEYWKLTNVKFGGYRIVNESLFYIEIWDKNLKKLGEFSFNLIDYFPEPNQFFWAEMDIPDIEVEGEFYIAIFGHSNFELYIGNDWDGLHYNRSYTAYRNGHLSEPHPNANRMIRAIGFPTEENCVIPTDGMEISEDTTFCQGEYYLPNGISINVGNITLDCNGAILLGSSSYDSNGIKIDNKQGVTVKNCNLENYGNFGLRLKNSFNNFIINNNVSNNRNIGIRIDESSKNNLINNSMTDNKRGLFVWGYSKDDYDNLIDTSNTVDDKPIYYYFDIKDEIIENLDTNHLQIAYGNNLIIKDNKIDGDGAVGYRIDNSFFFDNGFSSDVFYEGLKLRASHNNDIFNNTNGRISLTGSHNQIFSNNGGTIELGRYSHNNLVFDNEVKGIKLYYSNYNEVSNNNISGMAYSQSGINLAYSSNNNVTYNNIHGSGSSYSRGLNLWGSSWKSYYKSANNLIAFNNISNYEYGIYVDSYLIFDFIDGNKVYLGTEDAFTNTTLEYNNIYNNIYNFYNKQPDNFTAENNWWGTTDKNEIATKIYDYDEDNSLGIVNYLPFLCEAYPTDFVSNGNGMCISDEDNDGIPDNEDKCPNTELPESFIKLKNKRYGDIDGDKIFETKRKKKIIDSKFSLEDTYGCSCKQILEIKHGKNKGEMKFGCSKGTIKTFIKKIGWAKNLF